MLQWPAAPQIGSLPMPDEWPPLAADIAELPVDELALRMLRNYVASNTGQFHRGNATNPSMWQNFGPGYSNIQVLRALAEAYDWLMFHGLVAVKESNVSGWAYITERGRAAAEDPNAASTIKATERLDVDLHPLLATRVRRQFLLGEYEAAVLLAFREVEIRVRDLGGFDASEIGSTLMMNAFNPDKSGPLVNPTLETGEQKSIQFLFAGAIGAFKNPSSHRQVDYGDPTVAAEAVLLADLLMRLLDQLPELTPAVQMPGC